MATTNQAEPRPPSRSAIVAAIVRAVGAKHPDPAFCNPDTLAAGFVGPRERALLPAALAGALDLDFEHALARLLRPNRVTHVFARARFFDDALADALRDGVRQVVILGAGLDSRGYRFAAQAGGVRFFEVDSPSLQASKQQRVREVLGRLPDHVRYVPVDLATDDLLTQLRAHGYAEDAVTHFVWEGVAAYLPEAAVRATLRLARHHAAPGSTLAVNYLLSTHPWINNPDTPMARMGELMVSGFPGESAADLLTQEGLSVVADLPTVDLAARYAQRPDGTWALPAIDPTSPGAHIRYCLARVPPRP
jgi:methyltransferase (TIGR00027 family)